MFMLVPHGMPQELNLRRKNSLYLYTASVSVRFRAHGLDVSSCQWTGAVRPGSIEDAKDHTIEP